MIPFSVITLGNFVSSESATLALKSFELFYNSITTKHQKRVHLYVIDEHQNVPQVVEKYLELGIEDAGQILHLSQQQEIEQLYKSGSVFLLPIRENKSTLVQESLSYGLPYIGFQGFGYEEYINHTCGMLIENNTDEDCILALARILQLLYFDPEARFFLKRSAKKTYESNFSWGSDRSKPAQRATT